MKLYIVVVYDRVASTYGQPSTVPNINGAIRGFADIINDPRSDNNFYKHPDDFDLYQVGIYDDQTAGFELLDKPVQIALGRDLVRPIPTGEAPTKLRSVQ